MENSTGAESLLLRTPKRWLSVGHYQDRPPQIAVRSPGDDEDESSEEASSSYNETQFSLGTLQSRSSTHTLAALLSKPIARVTKPRNLPSSVGPRGRPMKEFLSRYQLGELLGTGGTAQVWECTDMRTGEPCACKITTMDNLPTWMDSLRVRMEFDLHRRVSGHCHVAKAQELFEDEQCLCIVMEKCPGGDLFDLLQRVSPLREAEAAALFRQIVSAVKACHDAGVVHRDLKLENVLVCHTTIGEHMQMMFPSEHNWRDTQLLPRLLKIGHRRARSRSQSTDPPASYIPLIKLADFGSALPLSPGREAVGDWGGTKMYQAPEVLAGMRYGFKADTWSLGVILYALLSGAFPFRPPSESLLSGAIKRGIFEMQGEEWDRVSDLAKDAVCRLLQVDASRRWSASEIAAHPWLRCNDWC